MAQMEVSYSRRLDYQYMIINVGEDIESDYRLSMLIHNRIDGFLPVHIQQMNGRSTLNYEITSLEDLPSFLDARKITYDEMVSLLLQFCSAVSEVGRYLLDGEGILLEPQYIFVSKSLERVRFCYYPYSHMPLYQAVNVLCRFLIDHIDYDDRKSLELAYGLFQESLKENLSIRAIVGCIKNKLEDGETTSKEEVKLEEVRLKEKLETQTEILQNAALQLKAEKGEKDLQPQSSIPKKDLRIPEKRSQMQQQIKHREFVWSIVGTLLVIAILGYALFTAGRRLLQLEIVSENMLIVAGILIAVVTVAVGGVAYGILKRWIP